MSKKSVSDIMKPVVIFPNDQSTYMTSRFEVRNHPIILRAFGIDCDTVGHIEMGYNDGCGGWFWGPYIPDCDQLALLGCANAIAIGLPGWYRIVFRDRITGEPSTGLDDLVVTITETDMPASMLAQFSGGSASMACGSQVSIREEDGCFYISVDNQAYTICPGDSVSCDPNGLGIVINGELCPFPAIPDVSVEVNEDGCLVIVVDGEATVFCPSPDSVTIIDALADDIYQATNPDGSVVQWNGANSITLVDEFETGQFRATNPDGSTVDWDGNNSITLVDEFETGQFRATNPDGSTVDWDGNNSITVVSDLGEGQFRAENPDGSLITWDGENSVTIADANTAEGTITITNPDGSQITFLYLEELPPVSEQTQVTRGTGGRPSMQTLTANHQGTYPNVSWRETWMERNGDVVTINSWNPVTNSWDAVAIEAPEGIVILNNPVIYLRPDGVANPPINTQADLTVANAFNSMNAIRNFMDRTLVVGLVTIDGRGAMNGGSIGPAQFKNAQNIVVRGDPADPAAFSFQNAGLGGAGVSVTGGNVVFQDMTFIVADTATVPSRFGIVGNAQGGTATLRGAVRFTGFYNASRTGSAPSYVMTAASGGVSHIDTGARITLAFTDNTEINALFSAFEGGTFSIGGDVEINVTTTNLTVREIIYIQQSSYFVGHMGTGASPVVTGNEINATSYSMRISPLASSIASSVGDANWGNNVANFMTWDWGQPTGINGFLSEIGVHGGSTGPYP